MKEALLGLALDVEEAVEVRQSDTAVNWVTPIRQLIICVQSVEVILTVLELI